MLKILLKDGCKLLHEISRKNWHTTSPAKAGFNRLVNVGFIKAPSTIFDVEK